MQRTLPGRSRWHPAPRCWARRFPTALIVEIAPKLVLMLKATGAVVGSESRSAPADVVATAIARRLRPAAARQVCIDAPEGVPGAAVLADLIATRVRAAGGRVHMVDRRDIAASDQVRPADLADSVDSVDSDARPARRDLRVVAIAAAALVVAVAAVIVIPMVRSGPDDIQAATATTALVEGRVSAQIPAGWIVRRVSTGPGSARVEVATAPSGDAVLHVTQSRVPDSRSGRHGCRAAGGSGGATCRGLRRLQSGRSARRPTGRHLPRDAFRPRYPVDGRGR